MLGHLAELAATELRADTLFMGIGAISVDQGLMNDSVPEILIDRALRRMARSVVVLADASKFEQAAPGFVFGLEEVRTLVTDDGARPETLAAVRRRGVEVVVAGVDAPPRRERRAMIAGTVPTEIREGPAAIRATVDAVGGPAREVAARWRAGRSPPDPRHRQRHELPLAASPRPRCTGGTPARTIPSSCR